MNATLEAAYAPAIAPTVADFIDLARVESYAEFIARGIREGTGFFRHHARAKGRRIARPCTLPLPGPDSGLTTLARKLVRYSYSYALDGLLYPVEEYAGPVPKVTPGDVFVQAGQILDEGDDDPAAVLKATRQALKFLGLD